MVTSILNLIKQNVYLNIIADLWVIVQTNYYVLN